tara:strand:- start:259 stop:414 length:156 start_codon:yes stop_codon:yes gene_type:complete
MYIVTSQNNIQQLCVIETDTRSKRDTAFQARTSYWRIVETAQEKQVLKTTK